MRGDDKDLDRMIKKAEREAEEQEADFSEKLRAAEALTAEATTEDVMAFIQDLPNLPLPQQTAIVQALKKSTGRTLGELRDYLKAAAQEAKFLEPDSVAKTQMHAVDLTLKHHGEHDLIHAQGDFWEWNSQHGIWLRREDGDVRHILQAVADPDKVTGSFVDGALKLLKDRQRRDFVMDAPRQNLINVNNGELFYSDQEASWMLQEHRRARLFTRKLPVDYDPEATCPRWDQFLQEIFEPDKDAEEKIGALHSMMGLTLLPTAEYEKFALLVGVAGSGKTRLLNVIKALLGEDGYCAVPPNKLGDDFSVIDLRGKLANITAEIGVGKVLNDDNLKMVVSGETVRGRKPYGQFVEFQPYATCWFGTNHKPHNRDHSNAVYRRARVFNFDRSFEGDRKKDTKLEEKLLAELPGILNRALAGAVEVLKEGDVSESHSMEAVKAEWRTEADTVAQFFGEECEWAPDEEVEMKRLLDLYQDWARRGGQRPVGRNIFGQRLKELGVRNRETNRDGKKARFYVGIRCHHEREL